MFTRRSTITVALLASLLALISILGRPDAAAGDDFRLDNKVFTNNSKAADSHGTTIFHGGMVYDFLGTPAEVIIFDKPAGRFVLLDLQRKVTTELTTKEVAAFCERVQQLAASQKDPAIALSANPQLHEQYDQQTGTLTLSNQWMSYSAMLATPPNAAVVEQYHDFSDWYARLNTVLNPGSRPPVARVTLNQAIARQKAIPGEVRLTLTYNKGGAVEQTTVRSEHQLSPTLSKADQEAIASAVQDRKTFKSVRFDEYRKRI